MKTYLTRMLFLPFSAFVILSAARPAVAKPEFAMKEKKDCLYCHVRPGEARGFRGMYYAARMYSFDKFDEAFEAKLAGVKPNSTGFEARPTVQGYPNNRKIIPVLDFTVNDIDGKPVNLNKYQGDVLLVVNVASFDDQLTRQYASLQRLYDRYKTRGFQVLAFPCNDFGDTEPGTDARIKDFARRTYEVSFQMMAKVRAVGPAASPFYRFLSGRKGNPQLAGDLDGNFTKFLINRKGDVVGRWKGALDPLSERIVREIDTALAYPREIPAAPASP